MTSRFRFVSTSLVWWLVAGIGPASLAQEDGRELFMIHCSACHGKNGDGNGSQPLDPKARNFREGKFQFGNSRTAFFRTISAGLPGRAVMPGFATVLSEEERWQIADFVRTFLPGEPEREDATSIMELTRGPQVVRGLLGPIVEGAEENPRGLLLGFPDGRTFEYRTDDVRLLGVRQGGFVDRRDWYGRGGAALKPLGQVVFPMNAGRPGPTFRALEGERLSDLHARLLATDVSGTRALDTRDFVVDVTAHHTQMGARFGHGGLEYELLDEEGKRLAEVYEEPAGLDVRIGWGFSRAFGVTWREDSPNLNVTLLESAEALAFEGEGFHVPGGARWFVVRRSEQLVWLLRVALPEDARPILGSNSFGVLLPRSEGISVLRFDLVTTISWQGDPALLTTLDREIATRG